MNPVRLTPCTRALVASVGVSLLLAAGCSDTESSTSDRYGSAGTTATVLGATTIKPARGTAAVRLRPTGIGTVLTDAAGRTLYVYTPDGTGLPTCSGTCSDEWPPYYVNGAVTSGPGVGASVSTVAGPNGLRQATVDGRPLYRYSGDAASGQTNGQSSNGLWFVLDVSGTVVPG